MASDRDLRASDRIVRRALIILIPPVVVALALSALTFTNWPQNEGAVAFLGAFIGTAVSCGVLVVYSPVSVWLSGVVAFLVLVVAPSLRMLFISEGYWDDFGTLWPASLYIMVCTNLSFMSMAIGMGVLLGTILFRSLSSTQFVVSGTGSTRRHLTLADMFAMLTFVAAACLVAQRVYLVVDQANLRLGMEYWLDLLRGIGIVLTWLIPVFAVIAVVLTAKRRPIFLAGAILTGGMIALFATNPMLRFAAVPREFVLHLLPVAIVTAGGHCAVARLSGLRIARVRREPET